MVSIEPPLSARKCSHHLRKFLTIVGYHYFAITTVSFFFVPSNNGIIEYPFCFLWLFLLSVFWDSTMLLHVFVVHSFLLFSIIQLHDCTIFFKSEFFWWWTLRLFSVSVVTIKAITVFLEELSVDLHFDLSWVKA